MKEGMQKLIDKQKEVGTGLAETQIAKTIGEATLTLLARAQVLTLDSLLAELAQQVSHRPAGDLLRYRNEAAQTALRDASSQTG